jgi:hypothetical protein
MGFLHDRKQLLPGDGFLCRRPEDSQDQQILVFRPPLFLAQKRRFLSGGIK